MEHTHRYKSCRELNLVQALGSVWCIYCWIYIYIYIKHPRNYIERRLCIIYIYMHRWSTKSLLRDGGNDDADFHSYRNHLRHCASLWAGIVFWLAKKNYFYRIIGFHSMTKLHGYTGAACWCYLYLYRTGAQLALHDVVTPECFLLATATPRASVLHEHHRRGRWRFYVWIVDVIMGGILLHWFAWYLAPHHNHPRIYIYIYIFLYRLEPIQKSGSLLMKGLLLSYPIDFVEDIYIYISVRGSARECIIRGVDICSITRTKWRFFKTLLSHHSLRCV
jgi:hypothetical protein